MGMGLNFGLQRLAPNVVTAPKTNIDYSSILGLTPSKYSGLQQVTGTPYYYGNNRMYEAYTPPSQTYNPLSFLSGVRGSSVSPLSNYPWYNQTSPTYDKITIDGQQFRTSKPDVKGFTKTPVEGKDYLYEYAPSMAYIYSQMRPQVTAQPNVMAVNAPGYQRASQMLTSPMATGSGAGRFLNTGNLLGFNFTPTQTTAPTTSNA